MSGLQISEEHKGKVSTKHRILLNILGNFLILFGRALKRVDTYEQLDALCNDAEKRFEEAEKINLETIEEAQLEEVLGPSINPPFLTYPGEG